MKLTKILAVAWENLQQRKLRTSLTTLGVVIGITAIIALASLGEGFRLDIKRRLEQGFELDVLIVFPGSFMAGFRQSFTKEDVATVGAVENVTLATGLITIPTGEVHKSDKKLAAFTVGAVNFTEMQEMLPQRFILQPGGHFPDQGESNSIVLGYKVSIFNNTKIVDVGENVTLIITDTRGIPIYSAVFNVTGILEKGGTSGITNFDYWAFIPVAVAAQIPGVDENYQIILAKVSNTKNSEQVAKNIESMFKQYSITIFVPSSLLNQVDNILRIIQLFLMAIASIALLVAGVGIMNIMTVAVLERTHEIGILKAIGAKSRTVLGMFLGEALLIGVIGGVIGIFAGYGLSYGLANILTSFLLPSRQNRDSAQLIETERIRINPVFSPEWTIIAFVFAIVVCIIFALYPARKASKLNPVDALRYE